jgi:hypothetical protein
MRSINRVEATRCLSDKSPKAAPIEHVRANRDILGESDARHCHQPGTWQMGVHHDLSPSGLGAAGDRRVM